MVLNEMEIREARRLAVLALCTCGMSKETEHLSGHYSGMVLAFDYVLQEGMHKQTHELIQGLGAAVDGGK